MKNHVEIYYHALGLKTSPSPYSFASGDDEVTVAGVRPLIFKINTSAPVDEVVAEKKYFVFTNAFLQIKND